MSHWCCLLVDINRLNSPHTIPVQCDCMYNNPLYSGIDKTQFQPATQTVYSFAEDVSLKRQIIKMVTKRIRSVPYMVSDTNLMSQMQAIPVIPGSVGLTCPCNTP